MSMQFRLNRLFGPDGRCFDVAMDHGMFGEPALLTGLEDLQAVVRAIVEAGPDAVQLTPGAAYLLQRLSGKSKPALVMRTDVANVYGRRPAGPLFSRLVDSPAEQAARLDAACVVVNVLAIAEEPDLYRQCLANVAALRTKCDRLGMPLMVEPLAFRGSGAGFTSDGSTERIATLVRQAVELGADVIKADFTDNLDEYREVVQAASGKPVLVRGGGRISDSEILHRTHAVLQQGAAGIVYGRNVFQHPDPVAMTRALMAVVHEAATPEQAAGFLPRRG